MFSKNLNLRVKSYTKLLITDLKIIIIIIKRIAMLGKSSNDPILKFIKFKKCFTLEKKWENTMSWNMMIR